jgi:hypothetical protein
MASVRFETYNKGRYCADPFKNHKKRIVKSLKLVPTQLLEKWKLDERKPEIMSLMSVVFQIINFSF